MSSVEGGNPEGVDGTREKHREKLFNAIQGSISDDERMEGSVLLQFAVISEWKSPDGNSWLSKVSGDAFNDSPPWRERMLGAELCNWETTVSCNCNCHTEHEEDE